MSDNPKPIWRPISWLPKVSYVIDKMLEDTQEQYQWCVEAKEKPWVLDDALVTRAMNLFEERRELLELDMEQLTRWEKKKLTRAQQKEVTRLKQQVTRNQELTEEILEILEEIKTNTIDQILAKDDAQLAIDILTGKIKSPFNP